MDRFTGKVAIVTGAARGMGAEFAQRLAAEGSRVVLTDLREPEGHEQAEKIGDAARFARHDVSRGDDWARVVALAEAEFGGVDILVSNAGIAVTKPIVDTTEQEYRRVVDVNQVGCFLGMQAVHEPMIRRGRGSIVNMSSVAGLVGGPNSIAYTASKFAIRGMTSVAAKEFGPAGIRVNSVHPGVIDTPMLGDYPNMEDMLAQLAAMSPLGRLGTPSDVAGLVTFLASDEAAFVTGAAFVVDGGVMQ